jgi:hypothetical protein
MSEQVEICRRKAGGCEWAAIMATKAEDKATYDNLTQQWLEVAEQAEEFEERQLALLRRLSTLSILP